MAMRSLLSPLFLWLMLASFLTEMAFSLFLHFPGFLTELGAGEFEIGVLYAVAAGVGVALRPWMGRLVDQRERRGVIIAAGLVNVSALLAYLTIDSFGVAVFVVAAVNASAQILLATAFFTFASEIVPTSRRTQGLALFGISFMLPIGLARLLGDGILAIAGRYRQILWMGSGGQAASLDPWVLLSTRFPSLNSMPAWTRATSSGLLTFRHRSWAASSSL